MRDEKYNWPYGLSPEQSRYVEALQQVAPSFSDERKELHAKLAAAIETRFPYMDMVSRPEHTYKEALFPHHRKWRIASKFEEFLLGSLIVDFPQDLVDRVTSGELDKVLENVYHADARGEFLYNLPDRVMWERHAAGFWLDGTRMNNV